MLLPAVTIMALLNQCQSAVDPNILMQIVKVESSRNEFAVGVVGMTSVYNPKTETEAIAYIKDLDEKGFNYSVGLMQVNKENFTANGLTLDTAFNSCKNIKAGANIFSQCFERAKKEFPTKSNDELLNDSASCYYSGTFTTGYEIQPNERISYVEKFKSFDEKKMISAAAEIKKVEIQEESAPPVPVKVAQSWDVFADFAR